MQFQIASNQLSGYAPLSVFDTQLVSNYAPTVTDKQDSYIVRLCFYEPTNSPDEPWLNRLVARFSSHHVCHVEILFHDNYAASIFADEVVFWRKRTFANTGYKIHSFDVPADSYWKMYAFAKDMSTKNIGFSNAKMICGPLIGWRGSSNKTYCSEFVTQTLQVGGVEFAMKMDASRSTPSTLLEFMNTHSNICFDTTAFKLGLAFG